MRGPLYIMRDAAHAVPRLFLPGSRRHDVASSGTIKHLWALDAPMLKVDKSIMILGAGGELVSLPSPSFLIEHAEHELLIFDTGLAGAGDPASTYGPLAELFMIEFPAERA